MKKRNHSTKLSNQGTKEKEDAFLYLDYEEQPRKSRIEILKNQLLEKQKAHESEARKIRNAIIEEGDKLIRAMHNGNYEDLYTTTEEKPKTFVEKFTKKHDFTQEEKPKTFVPKFKQKTTQKQAPSRKTRYRISLSVLTYLLVKHGVDSYATSIEVLYEAVSKYFRNKERNKFLFASFKRSIYEARRNEAPPKRSTEADIDKAERVFLSLIDSIKSALNNH